MTRLKNSFFIILVSLLLSHSICGQILIDYRFKNFQNFFQTTLVINDSVSLFKYDPKDPKVIDSKHLSKLYVFKNFKNSYILEQRMIISKLIYVKDSCNLEWKLGNKTKDILGQKCLSATTKFRGRNYTAYYATSFLYSDGPWKFRGLPGLILEVFSEDGEYFFEATKIVQNSKEVVEMKEIYVNKYVTWQEFATLFIKKWDDNIKRSASDASSLPGEINIIKLDIIEIIYPKLQTGKGIEF
jgi:GLPGLI family protein